MTESQRVFLEWIARYAQELKERAEAMVVNRQLTNDNYQSLRELRHKLDHLIHLVTDDLL